MTRAARAAAALAACLAASAALAGCSKYVREAPPFTTPTSRGDGFRAALFSDGKGEIDPDSAAIGEKVEEGAAQVRSSAKGISSILDEQAAALEEEAGEKLEWPTENFG